MCFKYFNHRELECQILIRTASYLLNAFTSIIRQLWKCMINIPSIKGNLKNRFWKKYELLNINLFDDNKHMGMVIIQIPSVKGNGDLWCSLWVIHWPYLQFYHSYNKCIIGVQMYNKMWLLLSHNRINYDYDMVISFLIKVLMAMTGEQPTLDVVPNVQGCSACFAIDIFWIKILTIRTYFTSYPLK